MSSCIIHWCLVYINLMKEVKGSTSFAEVKLAVSNPNHSEPVSFVLIICVLRV